MPRNDPQCPECGEAVSATASYCMHCYADLDDGSPGAGSADESSAGDERVTESAVVDFDAPSDGVEETATGTNEGTSTDTAARTATDTVENRANEPRSTSNAAQATGPKSRRDDATAGDRGWFHPDSLLDDASTGAVGILAGFVVGFLAMVLAVPTTNSAVGFLVWPVGWVAVGLYVGRTRSTFGAVRKACYVVAPTLVVLPMFWFAPALEGGSAGGRIFAFVVSEVVLLPVAAALAGLGYWVGGKAPD